MKAEYIFVIDTSDYAGNFEREMCAYLTGNIGECGVGDDYAKIFNEEVGVESFYNVTSRADEHGCYRPASIWLNSEDKYNSVAIFFSEEPTSEQISLMKERAYQFAQLPKPTFGGPPRGPMVDKILGFRLIKEETVRTITNV